MNTMFEREELEERQESEVTLSTGSLLAIFFGLVVVCGVFFGFGYSMGRHSSDTKAAAASQAEDSPLPVANRPKPSAVENLRAQPQSPASEVPASDNATSRTVVVDENAPQTAPATANRPEKPALVEEAPQAAPSTPKVKAAPKPVVAAAVSPAPRTIAPAVVTQSKPTAKPAASTPTMVQIAAVSHPEDAQALVAALKKRGYAVSLRNEPQDKLIHVQVGPFADRADAAAMRQKLLADGYNAILK
jgi:DedD protein